MAQQDVLLQTSTEPLKINDDGPKRRGTYPPNEVDYSTYFVPFVPPVPDAGPALHDIRQRRSMFLIDIFFVIYIRILIDVYVQNHHFIDQKVVMHLQYLCYVV